MASTRRAADTLICGQHKACCWHSYLWSAEGVLLTLLTSLSLHFPTPPSVTIPPFHFVTLLTGHPCQFFWFCESIGSLMLLVFAEVVIAGRANTINICHPVNLSNMWVPPPLCWTLSQCVLYQDIFELINLTYAGLLHRRYKWQSNTFFTCFGDKWLV